MSPRRPIHSAHWGAYRPRVQDGRLIAAEPFEADPDPSPLLSSVPGVVHANNRITRPAVRKTWLDGRPGRRGADPFVEVEWDEALDLVAEALRRVYRDSGPAAVFGGSYGWSSAGRLHHAKTQLKHFLACAGGYTGQISNYSYGAADGILPHVLGDARTVAGHASTWTEIAEHTDTLLMFGGFPAKNVQLESGGVGAHVARLGLDSVMAAGTQLINVNPVRSDAPEHGAVSWVPIRPNTDTALILAVILRLVESGHADLDFLDRYTVGFPRLLAYLRGETDGIEKTPTWAAGITGVPVEEIEALVARISRGRTLITGTWALQRSDHGEQPYWAIIALAAALGQIGLPGGGFGFGYGSTGGVGSETRRFGTPAFQARPNPVDSDVPAARLTDMLLRPGESYEFNGGSYTYPKIDFIYWAGGNPFHHHQDLNRLAEAWQRPGTVVVQDPWWTPTARMADIVLPATTTLERDDIAAGSKERFVVAMKHTIDPQGQARNDRVILADLAKRLGVWQEYTDGRDDAEALRWVYDSARSSAAEHGRAMPDFDNFWDAGFFEFPVGDSIPPFAEFRADPAGHPLATPSGRIEIFSETIASFGYDDCPGHPTWLEPYEWLGSTTPGAGLLHLLSPQPATRLHSQLDMGAVSLESKVAGREPCTMNTEDAADRGIRDGDLIRVWNERGELYAGARLSADVMPGVALLATGAWYTPADPSIPGSAELHGNPNVLSRDVGTSRLAQGATAQSLLVRIERAGSDVPWVDPHAVPAGLTAGSAG